MNACVPWNEYFVYSEIAQIVWLGSKHVYKTNERTPMSSFTSAIIIVPLTNEWESWQKDDMTSMCRALAIIFSSAMFYPRSR